MLRSPISDDAKLLGILARLRIHQAAVRGQLTADEAHERVRSLAGLVANPADAYHNLVRFLLELQGKVWGEPWQIATAFDPQLDRRLVTNSEPILGRLRPVFAEALDVEATYIARLTLETSLRQKLHELVPIEIHAFVEYPFLVPTSGLESGRYRVQYELFDSSGVLLVEAMRDFMVDHEVAPRLSTLHDQFDQLRGMPLHRRHSQQTARETIEYVMTLLDKATQEYVASMERKLHPMTIKLRGQDLTRYGGEPFELHRDLGFAEDLACELLMGRDPLAFRTGDLHLACRSAVDGSLQPFRAFIPEGCDFAKPHPLVIFLHGATGDENTYFDRYVDRNTSKNLCRLLGQERGFYMVSPNGRGPFGMYEGLSAQDVLDVRQRMHELYSVSQTFMTGHSMGGAGTWSLGFRHPSLFDGLAPVAGGLRELELLTHEEVRDMPILFCLGLADGIVNADSMRPLIEAARASLPRFHYREYPDADHFVVGVQSLSDIFEFFSKLSSGLL